MRKIQLLLLLPALFAGRLWFAFTTFGYLDSFQVYLIGLKYYLTGVYPYWGADVVYTDARIPGGLLGLLAGLPFFVSKSPESPYLLLQVLTFFCVGVFVYYLRIRFPELPAWWLWLWVLTMPWMVFYTTRIENPSYVIPMAMLFFVAVWDLLPLYAARVFPASLLFFVLGFGLLWIFQLHMSWVLLVPFIAAAFYCQRLAGRVLWRYAAFFMLGVLIAGMPLWPTLLKFGTSAYGGTEQNIAFNPENAKKLPLVAARMFSFGAYETARFCGNHTSERIAFLQRHLWAAPAALLVTIVGGFQVLLFAFSLFRSRQFAEWGKVRLFLVVSILLVYGGFLFAVPPPFSHAYVLMVPVVLWYSLYCYRAWVQKSWFKPVSLMVFISGIVYHGALGLENQKLFGLAAHRADFKRAIDTHDYTFVGLRRDARFEKAAYEPIWATLSKDSVFIFSTGFELTSPWFMPQNIVTTAPKSGMYCAKIDSAQAYSPMLAIPLKRIAGRRNIRFYGFLNNKQTETPTLVLSIKEGNNNLYWAGQAIAEGPTGTWQQARCTLRIPENMPAEAELNLYLWGHFAKRDFVSYVDELSVEIE